MGSQSNNNYKIMDYSRAVELALKGEEEGFNYLYESTYRSKYFMALKYMGNDSDAMDVIQDAYMRAFSKLDTLDAPNKFPSWIGTIVANTAKNALAKKNPVLFSDISGEDEDGEDFEYQIEDESQQYRPEVAYTKQETVELAHELINSLSEEQRMCILMFHIEGRSIREIAETLGCSENTVKSRLNYGRKNIKEKGEELQKKGYKLYGVAPLPLLVYLLRMENNMFVTSAKAAELLSGVVTKNIISSGAHAAQSQMANHSGGHATQSQMANRSGGQAIQTHAGVKAKAVTTVAKKEVAKRGAAHAISGKIIASVAGAAVVIGVATGTWSYNNSTKNEPVAVREVQNNVARNDETVIAEQTTVPVTEEITTSAPEIKSAKVTYKKIDKSRYLDRGKKKIEIYYNKPVLQGDTPAIKKINKAISADCGEFLSKKTLDEAYEDSKEEYQDYPESELFHYADTKVTYNKNGIISISVNTSHYTGNGNGRPWYNTYGMTFDLKTGKRLYLSDVCRGNTQQIKSAIKKEVRKGASGDDYMYINSGADIRWEAIDEKKIKDFKFYLNSKGKAAVYFDAYELVSGIGGQVAGETFEIKSKYK